MTQPDWDALRSALGRAIARICPPWLAADRDDLVQGAMLKVMRIVERGREGRLGEGGEGNGQLSSSYLSRVAYSTLVDEIRRRRRRKETTLSDEQDDGGQIPANDPGPERRARGAELGRAIRECLGGLVPPRRRAVTLHLQGHRLRETAALLGGSTKRTENLVYRGMKDLRDCLAARGFGG